MANVLAIATTVILLVFMGYFMLGSLPLLILKHDTPMDARFIRQFFQLYYRAVLSAALASAVAWAVAGKLGYCAEMLLLAGIVFAAWRTVLPRMDALRATMTAEDAAGIAQFRKVHGAGMALNVVQLLTVAFSLLWLKL